MESKGISADKLYSLVFLKFLYIPFKKTLQFVPRDAMHPRY